MRLNNCSLLLLLMAAVLPSHCCFADNVFDPAVSVLGGSENIDIVANDGNSNVMTIEFVGGNLSSGTLTRIGAGVLSGIDAPANIGIPEIIGWEVSGLQQFSSVTNDITLRVEFLKPMTVSLGVANNISPSDVQVIRTDGDISFAGGNRDTSSSWTVSGNEISIQSAFNYVAGDRLLSLNPYFEDATFIEFELREFGVSTQNEKHAGFSFDAISTLPFQIGDINNDGSINFLDISSFISILTNGGYLVEADINEDGLVNFFDIAPLIAILSGP